MFQLILLLTGRLTVSLALSCSSATCNEFTEEPSTESDALELRRLWNIAADSSFQIQKQTADWMPETRLYFKETFDWEHCLTKLNKERSTPRPRGIALMDPGLEPEHPKHSEATNPLNPMPFFHHGSPANLRAHSTKVGMPTFLSLFAQNFIDCKRNYTKLVEFEKTSKRVLKSNVSVDHLCSALKVQEAERLHTNLKTSIRKFSELAGEQATSQLLHDLEGGM